MADELFNALHHYIDQSRTIGICTIKLILYKNVIKKETLIRNITQCFYSVDHIKIKPKCSKLDSKTIYNLMLNSFINNKEKYWVLHVFNTCLKNKNPIYKIEDFKNNIDKYVLQLNNIYKKYLIRIIPMLADLKNYRFEDYETMVRLILDEI